MNRIHEHAKIDRLAADDDPAYLNKVIAAVEQLVREETPRRLVAAGFPDLASQMLRLVSTPLASMVTATIALPMNVSERQILDATRPLEANALRRVEMKEVGELFDQAARHRPAVLGVRPVIDEPNKLNVRQLVYSKSFNQRGTECTICGELYADEFALCPKCDVTLKPVDDLGDAIVARALNMNASVEEVTGNAATRLDKADGIGQFLR